MGVQVGESNTQIIYSYARTAWTETPTPPPLVTVSGFVESPYRGLNSYDERDAAFFFGREDTCDDVLGRMAELAQPALLMVSGVSGAGKSSLLQAGILPRIRGEGLPGQPVAAAWPWVQFTPTASPIAELAVGFAAITGVDPGELRRSLTTDPTDLRLVARQAAAADRTASPAPGGRNRRLILVVDQFEQLFTQCRAESQRRAFIAALHAAGTGSGASEPAALVVIGVRADYEARCADYPELADAVDHRYLVRAMTERQLRMAITEPARMAGGAIDEEVVRVLLGELTAADQEALSSGGRVRSIAGALPLLSHALDQAWRMRSGQTVTLSDYERTGGIEGAIGRSAQEVYQSLTADQQVIGQRVFTRLTVTDPDGVDTAARVSRSDLERLSGDSANVQAVLESFANERLLVLDADTVEISHETLLSAWPLLRDDWLAQSKADRIIRSRLETVATEWDRHDRDSSYLYSGSLLEIATAAHARITADPRQPDLGAVDSAFLAASSTARRRRRQRNRGLLTLLTLLVVAVAASAVVAVQQSRTAATERDVAISRQLITESEDPGEDPAVARFKSLAAWRINPSDDARQAMLAAAARPALAKLIGHTASVHSVAFNPKDGGTLASGGGDGTVRLWDVATHQPIGDPLTGAVDPITGKPGDVWSVAFSPDGRTLAGGGRGGTVRLWDVATHQPIGDLLTGNPGGVWSVAFNPTDGGTLASGDDDGTVRLWDVATHQPIGDPLTGALDPITSKPGDVMSVAFSPDGRTLAGGGSIDGTLRLWDVATHQPIGDPHTSTQGPHAVVESVAFSPDGRTLASGSGDGIQLWDVATQQPIGDPLNPGGASSVAFNPTDGRTLAGGGGDGIQLWDVATHQLIGDPLTGNPGGVSSVAFNPTDGRTLASGDGDGTVRLWDVTTHQPIGDPLSSDVDPLTGNSDVWSVAFNPTDGKTLASGDEGAVRLWDVATDQPIGDPLTGHTGSVDSVAFSPDGRTLASGGGDGTVRLWDVATHQPIGDPLTGSIDPITGSPSDVWSVAFSPDGRTLASGGGDGTMRLWDVATHQPIGDPHTGKPEVVMSVAFNPTDSRTLASGGGNLDGAVRLWDVVTDQPNGDPLTGHTGSVDSVAFSPDGRTLASGSDLDGTLRLWDVATHQPIGDPLSVKGVKSVAFSPDGRTLASGSDFDGTLRLWDVATHQPIGDPLTSDVDPITGKPSAVWSVAFSPDGRTLASGGGGTVQLWDVHELPDPASFLCATEGPSLTGDLWQKYVPAGPAYIPVCP